MDQIVLAHTVTPGGVSAEFLLIAGALLIVAVVGFFQKSVKPMVSVIIATAAVALGTGAFVFAPKPPAPPDGAAVEIMSPSDGESVTADEQIEIELDVTNFVFAHPGGHGGQNSSAGLDGHIHIYVDGEEVAMASSETVPVELSPGEHLIEAELVDPEHRAFEPQVLDRLVVDAG